jgi:hypothetical protein
LLLRFAYAELRAEANKMIATPFLRNLIAAVPYQTHQYLKAHIQAFLMTYNFAKRLKTLRGVTPYEYICQRWQQEPDRLGLVAASVL